MASSASPLQPSLVSSGTLWSRQSRNLKQGIKTGLAGAIAFAIYAGWNLPEGYWAVITALVVTQANLGASWKAALYRMIGSTAGAISAAALIPLIGSAPLRTGIALFLLASLFGYLTTLHPSFSAGGFTVAIILVFSSPQEHWQLAWYRVLYTLLGAFVAFAVSALIWPVRAREGLHGKLAAILEGCGALYRAVTSAAVAGEHNQEEIQQLGRKLHDLRRGITQQMEEARSELAFSRFHHGAYERFVDLTDQVRRRLTAMAEDSSLYAHAQVQPELVPSLPRLTENTARNFSILAQTVRAQARNVDAAELDSAVRELDSDLARLREARITAPFALDRMLPFWSLVFNLREVAQDLKDLESTLPELG